MTERRDFYWIDPEQARGLVGRIGLDGVGAMSIIAGLFYCGEPLADSCDEIGKHCAITEDEWQSLRKRLIDAGELCVEDGLLVPIGAWHHAERHS